MPKDRLIGKGPFRLCGRSAAVLSLMVVATCALRVEAEEVFTPGHIAKLRSSSGAIISPDGTRVAYVVAVPRRPGKDDNGPAWAELHVVAASGSSRPYVSGEVNVGSVKWTPDGKGISFLAKRGSDKHKSLYVIPVDGGEARRVLSHETDIQSYDWNPDGGLVAFLAKEKEPKEKKKLEDKGFNQEIFEEELRFVHLWIKKPDDEEAEARKLDLPGSASSLHWAPSGPRLVVALAPTPLIDDTYMKRKLHVVDSETGEILARVDTPGKLGQIAWSPDGTHLALIAAEDIHDPAAGRLMVTPASGGPARDILPGYMGHVGSIAWQDNQTIMFLGDKGAFTSFEEIRLDGTSRKTHVPDGQAVLSNLSLSANGQTAAMLGQSPRFPAEVFLMGHGDSAPRRLTDHNPWLKEMKFGRQEVVTYKARDGMMIDGILIRPVDEQPGRRYPLILHVHGGPESHNRSGWLTWYSRPGQLAASQGYAVFYPNYRGGTGRGVEFSKLGQADYAGKEFDDLIDGVDHLVDMGLADRDHVGVAGGSYGGFAAAWCATYHTKRFAAAVMFVGISDHISKAGCTDIPNEMTLVHARKHIWDDWQFFLQRSPIYYVEQARTPILIMHGKDDTRVPPSQSLELYRNLKVLNKTPVRLVWYPGEGHGNRKAGARYDYNMRMMRWFDHYLKGPGGTPPSYEIDYGLDLSKDDDSEEEE